MSQSPIEALRAETAAGQEPVAVPLGDVLLHVKPVKKWRSSGLRALKEADFDTWAATSLTEESAVQWLELDPTIEDIEDFFTRWSELSGQDVGKSPASAHSSKTTRTRSRRT